MRLRSDVRKYFLLLISLCVTVELWPHVLLKHVEEVPTVENTSKFCDLNHKELQRHETGTVNVGLHFGPVAL